MIKPEKEFKINNFLILRLENHKTIIYIANRRFIECKFLLINIPIKKIEMTGKIKSIDDAEERLDKSMEKNYARNLEISYDEEFWAHCSNLEAWAEYDYDTRILHRNLAFPLLKALTEAGDQKAKKAFEEEIALRMDDGDLKVIAYLLEEGYVRQLEREAQELFFYESHALIRKNIQTALKIEDSTRKYALLTLKGLVELGDETAKKISIEEFNNKRKRNNLSEYDLIVKEKYYKYLDRETMLNILLENIDAKAIHKLDIIVDQRWLEFKAKLNYETLTVEKYPNSFRKESLTLNPNIIYNSKITLDSYEFEVMDNRVTNLSLCAPTEFKLLTFPEPLLELIALQKLDLSFNLIAEIPESLAILRKLRLLNLNFNYIRILPESIGELELLERLELRCNKIEKIPNSIGKLKYLKYLTLDNNKLKFLPKSIGKLESLEILSLYHNKDLQSLPESIGSLKSLINLNIAHTNLISLPETIITLRSLREISIDSTQIDLYPLETLKKKGIKIKTI